MKIMLVGSSWAVGAWRKSEQENTDDIDSPGVAELLSEHYSVTNFSQRAAFNTGTFHLAQDNRPEEFDLILACQTDVFTDLAWKHGPTSTWRDIKNFDITEPINSQALLRDGVDDLHKLIDWLLNNFYANLAGLGRPVVVFASSSIVNESLAHDHGLVTVTPDWCKLLVPDYVSSYVESKFYLGWATELLLDLFPYNRSKIQQQCLDLMEQTNTRIELYQAHPELFAYHHPTVKGNRPMADLLLETLKNYG